MAVLIRSRERGCGQRSSRAPWLALLLLAACGPGWPLGATSPTSQLTLGHFERRAAALPVEPDDRSGEVPVAAIKGGVRSAEEDEEKEEEGVSASTIVIVAGVVVVTAVAVIALVATSARRDEDDGSVSAPSPSLGRIDF